MKILILNHEFPPLGGGAANATFYLCKEFSKLDNLEIDLITSSINDKFYQEKFSENINLYRIPLGIDEKSIHYKNNKKFIKYFLNTRKIIKKLFERKKYDISHAFFTIPAGAICYSFKNKIPYIVSIRGSDVPGYDQRFAVYYKFLSPIIKKIWQNAKIIVANSRDLKNLALKTNPHQEIKVIYNGIDTEEFCPISTEKDDSLFKIICVAHLIRRKGIEYLIEAIAKLTKNFTKIKLTIVGIGDLENELKNQTKKLGLEKYIEFKGLTEHLLLPQIYNQSDAFVLPSLNEGMSNAALEAMACGLPVILTNTGGTKKLIKNSGFIVPQKNSQIIADNLLKLIENGRLRKEMGQKSREIAKGMSWRKVAEQYYSLYKEILNTKFEF